MTFDSLVQRKIMGRFATGVTLITTRSGEVVWGMTANAVTSLSLHPPLILIVVDQRNTIYDHLKQAGCFAVNVLTADQEATSRRFAAPGPKDFAGLGLTVAQTGAPILVNALAFVDCRLAQILPGGDHDIFIGEAVAGAVRKGQPLIFYGGKYTQLSPATFVEELPAGPYTLEDTYNYYGSF